MRSTKWFHLGPVCVWVRRINEDAIGFQIGFEVRWKGEDRIFSSHFREFTIEFHYNRDGL